MKKQPKDLIEQIAKALHDGWKLYRKDQGVVFGPKRTETTHPHLVEWDELGDEESKNQDRFQAAYILIGMKREEIKKATLAESIHNGWMLWEEIHGTNHHHAKPYSEAHKDGPNEHGKQAEIVWDILEKKFSKS